MIDIGRLDKRVTIQSRVTTKDVYGEESTTWNDVCTVWASIKPIGGREKLRSGAVGASISTTIAVRYRASLADPLTVAGYRVLYSSRIYNILGSRDVEEKHEHIILDCSEGTVTGQ